MTGVDAYLRKKTIASRLNEKGGAAVCALLQELDCSYATLARDLDQMEKEGRVRRVHGGVVPTAPLP